MASETSAKTGRADGKSETTSQATTESVRAKLDEIRARTTQLTELVDDVSAQIERSQAARSRRDLKSCQPGLPAERLREVWATWINDDGNVCTFRGNSCRFSFWGCDSWEDVSLMNWTLSYRPHGKTLDEVEAMSRKLLCPVCGRRVEQVDGAVEGERFMCRACKTTLRMESVGDELVPRDARERRPIYFSRGLPSRRRRKPGESELDLRELLPGTACEVAEDVKARSGLVLKKGDRFVVAEASEDPARRSDANVVLVRAVGEVDTWFLPAYVPARVLEKRVDRPQPEDADRRAARHCDTYIEDQTQPKPLREFLAWARSEAHGSNAPRPHPRLYATLRGRRVRVVMASRLGDVGVTTKLESDRGYEERVNVAQLTNFSSTLGGKTGPE